VEERTEDTMKKVQVLQPKAEIEMQKQGAVSTEQVSVGPPMAYDQPTCNVGVKAGVTRNLGNYNSVRVDVSLYMPCYPAELEEVYIFAQTWVDDKLSELCEQIESE
jgi:hypothetical protein